MLAFLVAVAAAAPLAAQALSAPASPPGDGTTLTAELDALFLAPPFDRMHVGALVVDVASGEVVYRRDDGRRFVPASNQKLLTTQAALERWGAGHRFRTTLEIEGELDPDGVLAGDLVVHGSGDPTLSARFHDDDEAPLVRLVEEVRAAGVRHIRGDLVIDALEWSDEVMEETRMWGDLPFGYGAIGGVFVIGEGRAAVEVEAGEVGGEVALRWHPLGDPDRFHADVRVVAPGERSRLSARVVTDRHPRVEVTGTLTAHTRDTLELSVQEPVREAGLALRRVLANHGIEVDGGLRIRSDSLDCRQAGCPRGRVVAVLPSPPLIEIVQGILEPSQNWMADQLLWALGHDAEGEAGWDTGTAAVTRILVEDLGADSLDFVVRDGSGLSAYNLVTPRTLIHLLDVAQRRPWGAEFTRALAEPGEAESTLEERLGGLEGRVFAKTGTITHVNSLSGYLDTRDGRRLAFAFLTNASGVGASQIRPLLDRAVRLLAGAGADDSAGRSGALPGERLPARPIPLGDQFTGAPELEGAHVFHPGTDQEEGDPVPPAHQR